MYIWEANDWPSFRWNSEVLIGPVAEARFDQGRFLEAMGSLGFDAQLTSELEAMSADVIKTSAIEGEVLNPASVRSSISRRLGLSEAGLAPMDQKVEGVVEMMLDVTRNHAPALTVERIFGWHAALFPTGYSGISKIDVGRWRTDANGPMQVISGRYGRQKVHYEAPPAGGLEAEMARFLRWFNEDSRRLDGILRSGIAHLWFVTIHPLDDGNGRCARAVADLAIAQMEGTGQRFYSMSSQIERETKTYYELLEATQKGGLDITDWLEWFAQCYRRAVLDAEKTGKMVVDKARFLRRLAGGPALSERQAKIVRRLLDGFEGNLTSTRYASMAGCSQDTASRDIGDLIEKGILARNPGGGKRTSFSLTKRGPDIEPQGENPVASA